MGGLSAGHCSVAFTESSAYWLPNAIRKSRRTCDVISEIDRKRALTAVAIKSEPMEECAYQAPPRRLSTVAVVLPASRFMPPLETETTSPRVKLEREVMRQLDFEPYDSYEAGFYDPKDPDYEERPSRKTRARMRSVLAKRKPPKKPSPYGPGRRKADICPTQGCHRLRDTAEDNTTYKEWTFAKCPQHQREAWTLSKRKAKQLRMRREASL